MQRFDSDGVEIAFVDEGAGDAVLLIHGFGTTATINWLRSGWAAALNSIGRRVIALDQRGHGESEKLYGPSAYKMAALAEDARRLLDHLRIERADVLGYSMGARVAAMLAVGHSERVRSLILGGMGANLVTGMPSATVVAAALEADGLDDIKDPKGRMFRQFAERTEGDLKALAACMRCPREPIAAERLAALAMPILIAIGAEDTIAGPIADIARSLPAAECFDIRGCEHMRAAVDDGFKARSLEFLTRHGPAERCDPRLPRRQWPCAVRDIRLRAD